MTENDLAAALKLQTDSKDIAAIVIETVSIAAQREGRSVEQTDIGQAVGIFLGAAYQAARLAHPDPKEGRRLYLDLLRKHADDVEAVGAE